MNRMFESLSVRNYRLYATGALVSNAGTWMQRVAQDWLVLTVLTNHSPIALGVTTGLQFLPTLLLSPVSGLLADRLPKRKLMIWTQALMGLTALLLGLLVLSGAATLWQVYLLATVLGVVSAVDTPTRQTFVAEMVPADKLSNAVGLNSASFNSGRLIGPDLAGLLIAAFGTGPVFLINAASFGATITALLAMRVSELTPIQRAPRAGGQIRAGLSYIKHRPDLLIILGIAGMVGTFGLNFQMTTALMATQVYGKGAGEYGLLGSIMAIGSLAGALLAARRRHPRMRLLLGAALCFGIFACVASLMPTYATFAIALIPTGMSSLTLMTAANTIIQMTTEPAMRGRVIALYMAVFAGGTPLGAPIIGWVGEVFGARWTIAVGGIVSLVCAVIASFVLLRVQGRRVQITFGRRPRVRLVPTQAPADPVTTAELDDARDLSSAA